VKVAEPASIGAPSRPDDSTIHLYVVFTGLNVTRIALQAAGQLARGLHARVVLMVGKVVPFPLPLDSPPVANDFAGRVLSELAGEQDADVAVRVYLCRDREETIRGALPPASLVFVGCGRWPSSGKYRRFARQLRKDGHEVIAVTKGRVQLLRPVFSSAGVERLI
jgi:hypothetical protein